MQARFLALSGSALFLSSRCAGDGAAGSARADPQLPDSAEAQDEEVRSSSPATGCRCSSRCDRSARPTGSRKCSPSDDIGLLPEASIAELLARLPGITTNRDRGNGTAISIRGMGPNLVNTLLNGREIASAEASRNVRYEQYPAELINGAFIFKSPTAAQVEGAIAGQVDLRTVRPLGFSDSRITVNLRGNYNTEADEVTDTDAVRLDRQHLLYRPVRRRHARHRHRLFGPPPVGGDDAHQHLPPDQQLRRPRRRRPGQ